jgi:hypothetical protein
MTAIGWIVVLGGVAAYALLWVSWWRGLQSGPREWAEAQNASAPASSDMAASSI